MPQVTICYVTNRTTPHWDWAVDALCNQADFDLRRHLQLVVIDGKLWADGVNRSTSESTIAFADPQFHNPERRFELELVVNNRIETLHIPPLPNVYNGNFRLTPKDWFSASNSRNTGFIAARHGYVAFIDDLSVPGPIWLAQVLHAAHHGYTVAGMYAKSKKMIVRNGAVVEFEDFPEGRDSRWEGGSDGGIVDWGGSLYGCSFGIPLELALTIDGFELATSGAGGEDFDAGIRIRRSGAVIKLNRNMFSRESEEDHWQQPLKDAAARERKLVIKENLPSGYDAYELANHEERYYSDHVLLNRVTNEARITPIIPSNLRAIRQMYLATGRVPIPTEPHLDWRDNSALSSA